MTSNANAVEVINYEVANKNKIIGYVDIRLPKWGIIIRRIAHLQSGDKKWFNFPAFAKPQEDMTMKYVPYVQFELGNHNGQFFEMLKEKVAEFCDAKGVTCKADLHLDNDLPF